MRLPLPILRALRFKEITRPTPIQLQGLPIVYVYDCLNIHEYVYDCLNIHEYVYDCLHIHGYVYDCLNIHMGMYRIALIYMWVLKYS